MGLISRVSSRTYRNPKLTLNTDYLKNLKMPRSVREAYRRKTTKENLSVIEELNETEEQQPPNFSSITVPLVYADQLAAEKILLEKKEAEEKKAAEKKADGELEKQEVSEQYYIECIRSHRPKNQKDRAKVKFYETKWFNYGEEDNTEETSKYLEEICPDIVDAYWEAKREVKKSTKNKPKKTKKSAAVKSVSEKHKRDENTDNIAVEGDNRGTVKTSAEKFCDILEGLQSDHEDKLNFMRE